MQARMRQKCPWVSWKLSRIAASSVSPRSTSRYSAKTSLIITHMPGSTNIEIPSMINRVLMAASKAKVGHRRRAMASRSRFCGSRPWLRASRNRINAAVYKG
ncbi:hypothetical protein D9M73_284560 [compost metagenome]